MYKTKLFCLVGLGFYVALSVADFALTFSLIEGSGGEAFEANPIAAVWLEEHGWTGLAAFKGAGVLVFLGTIALLVRRRPRVAAGLVALGCSVLIGVTTYSGQLMGKTDDPFPGHGDVVTIYGPVEKTDLPAYQPRKKARGHSPHPRPDRVAMRPHGATARRAAGSDPLR